MPIIVLLLALGLVPSLPMQARGRDLTAAEARDLVMAALEPEARALPKLSIDVMDRKERRAGFYEFAVTWDSTSGGSVMVGFYAVDETSGDVWTLVACRKISSRDLQRLQRTLRKRTDLSQQDLKRLGRRAPCEP